TTLLRSSGVFAALNSRSNLALSTAALTTKEAPTTVARAKANIRAKRLIYLSIRRGRVRFVRTDSETTARSRAAHFRTVPPQVYALTPTDEKESPESPVS